MNARYAICSASTRVVPRATTCALGCRNAGAAVAFCVFSGAVPPVSINCNVVVRGGRMARVPVKMSVPHSPTLSSSSTETRSFRKDTVQLDSLRDSRREVWSALEDYRLNVLRLPDGVVRLEVLVDIQRVGCRPSACGNPRMDHPPIDERSHLANGAA